MLLYSLAVTPSCNFAYSTVCCIENFYFGFHDKIYDTLMLAKCVCVCSILHFGFHISFNFTVMGSELCRHLVFDQPQSLSFVLFVDMPYSDPFIFTDDFDDRERAWHSAHGVGGSTRHHQCSYTYTLSKSSCKIDT